VSQSNDTAVKLKTKHIFGLSVSHLQIMLIIFLCQIHCMLEVASLTTDLQLKRPCLDLDNTTQYLILGGLNSLNHTTGLYTETHWLVKILFRNRALTVML